MRAPARLPGGLAPLLRFAVGGALLFALFGDASPGPAAVSSGPAAVPPGPAAAPAAASDDELLFRAAIARGDHERDPIVRRRLARNLRFALGDGDRDEDALVREAIAMGMHRSDRVVRRRLVQKMELDVAARARAEEPSEAELRAFLEAHAERFTEPARVRGSQHFFDERARAASALARLRTDPDTVPEGDALPLPRTLPWLSEAELAARFGPDFARRVMALPIGRWSGPVASAYGLHLVRVDARQPARRSPLEVVRGEVREALLAERAARALARELAALRAGSGR